MEYIYDAFPEKLLKQSTATRPSQANKELQVQMHINAELLKICQRQQHLLDEQSSMITEILESMGR